MQKMKIIENLYKKHLEIYINYAFKSYKELSLVII